MVSYLLRDSFKIIEVCTAESVRHMQDVMRCVCGGTLHAKKQKIGMDLYLYLLENIGRGAEIFW